MLTVVGAENSISGCFLGQVARLIFNRSFPIIVYRQTYKRLFLIDKASNDRKLRSVDFLFQIRFRTLREFFRRFQSTKAAIEGQVIYDFESARQEKRGAKQRRGEQHSRQGG